MEFGRVDAKYLDYIDFSLPTEPAFNATILSGTPFNNPKIYPGCPSWARPEWLGMLYPLGTKPDKYLQYYAQHFSGLELNTTYYKIYSTAEVNSWATKTAGRNFKFCPKIFQGITHEGTLFNKQALTKQFLDGITAFGDQLGPIFIQLNEAFAPERKTELFQYISNLPQQLQFFLELRHPDWFGKADIKDELFNTLKAYHIGAILTDTPGRRDCAHMQLTVPKAFVRFVGNGLHATDYSRIDEWVVRIKHWLNEGLQELYFFIHMKNEINTPHLLAYLADQLNATLGHSLMKPTFLPQQKNLFD